MKSTKRFRKTEPPKAAMHVAGIQARRYETKLDAKKRVVLRGAQHTYYEVKEKANGSILLTPKRLVGVEPISARTLAMIDRSMKNLDKGLVFGPVDLSEFQKPERAKRSR